MRNELKLELKTRAVLARGLLNILQDDITLVNECARTYNLTGLMESINESRSTIQKIAFVFSELERTVYLAEHDL